MLMQANNIAIFVHKNPDGDTMGAGFGLWNMLNSLGKVCAVYSSDGVPTRYAYLAEGCTLGGDIAFAPDFFVAVDVADPKLMGDFANMADKIDLCIDHHVSNVGMPSTPCWTTRRRLPVRCCTTWGATYPYS